MKKLSNIKIIIENNFFILRFLIKYVPLYVILTVILYIAKGMLQSLSNVWLVEKVVDSVINNQSFSSLALHVLIYSVYAISVGLFNALFIEIVEKVYQQRFSDQMRMQLYRKAIDCDINCYDNAEFYNNYVWVAKELDTRVFSVFQTLVMFIQRLTVISSTIILLSKISPWILLVVLLSCILNFIFTIKQNKMQFKLNQKINELTRKKGYVNRILTLSDYAKELRTSKISQVLYRMFHNTNREMESEIKLCTAPIWKLDFSKKLIGEDIAVTFISIMVLSRQVMTKVISIGSFLASYNGIQIIHTSLSFLLGRASAFSESSMYIEKFKKFWFYKPAITTKLDAISHNKVHSITLNKVCFSYDCFLNNVLNDISFDFTKPQKIAIVGSNGSGKTTLIKLLLRLYDANKGSITNNGVDIKNLNLDLYRDRFSCLFQDFNLYACTLSDNIVMGSSQNIENNKLYEAISKSGFQSKFETLPNGVNTVVTREFNDNGILLSGGEKQKIAIARVLYQDADCYILDEPTAALDPIAEMEFNRAIMKFSENKLLIIISHRLTTTRYMDKILVLDDGKVIEVGSHNELLSQCGRYAALYGVQANQYSS